MLPKQQPQVGKDCRSSSTVVAENERPEAEQHPINSGQIGYPPLGPINDQWLLFHKEAIGDDRLGIAWSQERGESY